MSTFSAERDYKIVQGLVFNLTLPCAIILSFATNKHDMRMLWIVLFGFFACAIPLFIVYFGFSRRREELPRLPDAQRLGA